VEEPAQVKFKVYKLQTDESYKTSLITQRPNTRDSNHSSGASAPTTASVGWGTPPSRATGFLESAGHWDTSPSSVGAQSPVLAAVALKASLA
jgi:hypothetical protein